MFTSIMKIRPLLCPHNDFVEIIMILSTIKLSYNVLFDSNILLKQNISKINIVPNTVCCISNYNYHTLMECVAIFILLSTI